MANSPDQVPIVLQVVIGSTKWDQSQGWHMEPAGGLGYDEEAGAWVLLRDGQIPAVFSDITDRDSMGEAIQAAKHLMESEQ